MTRDEALPPLPGSLAQAVRQKMMEVISMSEYEQGVVDAPEATSGGSQGKVITTHLGLTREEMNWAALAHASVLVTLLVGIVTGGLGAILGVIIPAVIWYAYRDKSEYVTEQARQATIFQLVGVLGWYALILLGLIVLALGAIVGAVLTIILVGLLVLLVVALVAVVWGAAIVVLPIAQTVYGCYAAAETYNGRPFRYRWIADLTDRYLLHA
jgi:uncharacterized Tic20 family protein